MTRAKQTMKSWAVYGPAFLLNAPEPDNSLPGSMTKGLHANDEAEI
jgi:hypothetical protein